MENRFRIKLIVGLGNPGDEYAGTRHNAGFEVVERLLKRLPGTFEESSTCGSRCFSGRFRGRTLFVQMPQTFMNLSGRAVAGLARRQEIAPEEILVVYDDLDLPVGRIRIRTGGAAGGHHGVESVIEELGSAEFVRLRVGIGGAKQGGTIDYVLSRMTEEMRPVYEEALDVASEAALAVAASGAAGAMNKFNAWRPAAQQENKQAIES
jgi:PTH1 family peptidyl-tRNA hydrolase